MNNKKTTDTSYKRLIPMAESTKPDDLKRNRLMSGYNRNYNNKRTDPSDQPISSPSLLSNVPSFASGRSGVIDAQTYVDAQSNGLTKRIVRYDEENKTTPNVYNRAYKRPGDFPIVHLQKPKLVLTPKRGIANPPKMARIGGQPDTCINRTNIRAEILRNGTMMPSMISVDRREDVDSCNVRVDPLDALKEISRKRIHCEDTINPLQAGPIVEKDSTDSIPTGTTACNNSKRQRIASSINSPSFNDTSKKGSSASSKCNEILSSLSSSSYMLSDSLKRAKVSSPNNSISPPQAKRLHSEKSIETPTTAAVDATVNTVPKPVEKIVPEVVVSEKRNGPAESIRPKLTLFNRPYTATTQNIRVNNDRRDECNVAFVKPRPMTAGSRESVENWLKIKPDDKRRLSLMLKCLSGEVDDDSDTVDSEDKVKEPLNPPAVDNALSAAVNNENNAREKSISSTVTSTVQVDTSSKTTSLIPSNPVITFGIPPASSTSLPPPPPTTTTSVPVVIPTIKTAPDYSPAKTTVSAVLPTITPTKAVQANADERKGGFSFPLATQTTATTISSSLSSSVNAPIKFTSSSTPSLATVTPLAVTSSTNTIPKDPLPTSIPSVSFTFHPSSKSNITSPSSSVVTATVVQPEKTFTFGNVANESKSTPVFGTSTVDSGKSTTTTGNVEGPTTTKSMAFGSAAFGQTTSIGNVDFGKVTTSSSTSIFGAMTAANKVQPPSFGSISTTQQQQQQTTTNHKPIQSNMTSAFSKNEQTPVFGSALSNIATTTNHQTDPRTSNITTSFTSIPASTPSFAFGATANAATAFKGTQPASSSFGSKPMNSTANMFGSMTSQTQQPSMFGSSNFNQTPKMDSIKSLEPEKNPQNIFGSTAPKPSSAFTFSANSQPNANTNIFGGGQTTATGGTGNTFNFGGSGQKSDSSAANKSFTFNANNTESKPVAFGATQSVAPSFGTSNATDSAKSFGFAAINQTSSTNLFNNKSTNEVPKVFSFGGDTSNNNPSSTNATPKFGGPSASFGSSSAVFAPTFGNTNAAPTFGKNAAPSAFGGNSSSSAFGSANTQNTTPSFGGINAAPVFGSSGNSTPVFGSATSAFGTNSGPSVFGNTAPPAFGGGGSSATPSFGGSSSGETQFFSANSGTSSFGTNSNSGTPAFTTSTGTADANRTFNFTGNDPAPSPVQNLFSMGPGNPSAPRGRTIRTATRRTYR